MSAPEPPTDPYSRAFRTFVADPQDLTGLLAYALYKKIINERRLKGLPVMPSADRNPQAEEVALYRGEASQYLRAFTRQAIDGERATIVQSAMGTLADDMRRAVAAAALEVSATVRDRTAFWPGVLIGIVAWVVSIVLTILVVYSAPDWVKALVEHVGSK